MPRHKGCKNNTTYHFKVIYDDYFEGEKEKLFRTCGDIEETFKISRSTIYNYYMNISKTISHNTIISIEKLNPPIERYKKILVEFD
tara:strand:- start:967 stop:1224 length:258 start_codon:yes stop_codon:yes gene_type:complete